jgi:2-dehydropantoate 2-reductase
VRAIEEKGLRVSGIEEYSVDIAAFANPSTVDSADVVFLTVKTQDTKSAVGEFAPYLGESTPVVSLQNGVRNPDLISGIVGEQRVIPGVVRFMASYLQPGEIEHTWEGQCIIGERNGEITERIEQISKYMKTAVETEVSENIEGELWAKLIINLINIPLAVTGCSFPFGLKDRYLRKVVVKTWNEGRDVLEAAGITATYRVLDLLTETFKDDTATEAWLNQQSPDIRVHPSTHQSLVRGSTDESDYITGEIIRLGEQIGMRTPANTLLMQKLQDLRQRSSIEYLTPETLLQAFEDADSS